VSFKCVMFLRHVTHTSDKCTSQKWMSHESRHVCHSYGWRISFDVHYHIGDMMSDASWVLMSHESWVMSHSSLKCVTCFRRLTLTSDKSTLHKWMSHESHRICHLYVWRVSFDMHYSTGDMSHDESWVMSHESWVMSHVTFWGTSHIWVTDARHRNKGVMNHITYRKMARG